MDFEPAYRSLLMNGELEARVAAAYLRLAACDICPRQCRADRLGGELGECRTGRRARVSSYGPHHGEEDPLRGTRGSGTIFFACCNLGCVFCQNAEISQVGAGQEVEAQALAAIMLELQDDGCHNINLVSPTHVVPQILAALSIAAHAGLELPIVYNSGGYDALDTLALLDGVVDIYMPDMKYADAEIARKYSGVPDYPQFNRAAVREMQRQVGDLWMDEAGIARRGLLVRHLLLPGGLAGTEQVLRFLAQEISPQVYLNLMDQYRPAYQAGRYPELDRPVTRSEYQQALELARSLGLKRLDQRFRRW